MQGILAPGQTIQIDQNFYSCQKPKIGDLVTIKKSGFPAEIVKQIFASPGSKFKLVGNRSGAELWVDGKPIKNFQNKTYRFSEKAFDMLKIYQDSFKGVLPSDQYFVFGSQGGDSRDSSRFGPVNRSEIIGKVLIKP